MASSKVMARRFSCGCAPATNDMPKAKNRDITCFFIALLFFLSKVRQMVCQKTISLFYNTLQQKWSVRNRTLHSYTNTADHVTMK
jgi:hypothetical protein